MGIVKQIAIFVLGLSFAVFVAFFGRLPVFRHTPIGFLHRLIWIHIPNGLAVVDQYVTGGRLGSRLRRTGNHLMYEKHPIVLIFFLTLLLVSELLFIPPAIHLLPDTFPHSPSLLYLQYFLMLFLITPPYIFLHLAHSTSSTITSCNHSCAMLSYPYDHTIFHGPQSSGSNPSPLAQPPCRTCHLAKPARSKHCSICKSCIEKADHHCVWINNCVGRSNYLYFLCLMLSIAVLLAYGVYLGHKILDMQIQIQLGAQPASASTTTTSSNLLQQTRKSSHWSKSLSWTSYLAHFSTMLSQHPLITAPALLCLFSFPLTAGLTIYHVYLIWAGMTTNESGKWADLREDIGEGRVWRAKVEDLKGDFPSLAEGDGDGRSFDWPIKPTWLVVRMEEVGRRPRVRRRRRMKLRGRDRDTTNKMADGHRINKSNENIDADAGSEGSEPEQWEEDERWSQVRSLTEIENIYDLGFWENLKDVLFNRE